MYPMMLTNRLNTEKYTNNHNLYLQMVTNTDIHHITWKFLYNHKIILLLVNTSNTSYRNNSFYF